MTQTHHEIRRTICQVCHNCCPIEVEVADGRAVKITGNKRNRHFDGFSCGKGRRQLAYHYSPDRLLASQKRQPDGSFAPISAERATDEIAERLGRLVEERGPRAVALYFGTMAFQSAGASMPLIKGFMNAVGSTMVFDSVTIDQPGKTVARALHGMWMAPRHTPNEADVLMLIGANPWSACSACRPATRAGGWPTSSTAAPS